MVKRLITQEVRDAAKLGFIRTAGQTLSVGIPVAPITATAVLGVDMRLVAASIVGIVLTSLAAGLASYLNILTKGIPQEYADAHPAPELPEVEDGVLGA